MYIGRTLPPAASPIGAGELISGLRSLVSGRSELERLAAGFRDHFGARYCFLVSSGKTALTLILQALKDLQPHRDEVVIPAFTCYSVPSAIIRAGLKVRLCDVQSNSFDFDEKKLERLLYSRAVPEMTLLGDERTSPFPRAGFLPKAPEAHVPCHSSPILAIVPIHLFGFTAGMDGPRRLALREGLPIVEDAAQAMGGEWNGRKLGTWGDVGFFSLGRGKAFSTVEGGVILTNREDVAERLSLRVDALPDYTPLQMIGLICRALSIVFFQNPSLFWLPKSLPFLKLGETIFDPDFAMRKMSAFQAGLARNWEGRLQEFRRTRRENVTWFKSALCSLPIGYPGHENGSCPSLLRLPLSVHDPAARDALLARSRDRGLGVMGSYPDSIDGVKELKELHGQAYEQARTLARSLVTVPVHPFVSNKDKSLIVELFEAVLGKSRQK